jgi:hypothetical protein
LRRTEKMVDEALARRAKSTSRKLLEFEAQGLIPLPPEIKATATGVQNALGWEIEVKGKVAQAFENVDKAERAWARRSADAARAGKPLPSYQAVIKARQELEHAEQQRAALADALAVALYDFRDAVHADAEAAITALNPRLEKVVTEVRECAEPLGDEVSADAALRSEPARAGWLALERLVGEYSALRECWRLLSQFADLKPEDGGAVFFDELRDASAHRPRAPGQASKIPTTSASARLAFISRYCRPWLPTPEQMDEVWTKYLEETGEAERRRRHRQTVDRFGYGF